jgi:hypothetical protein
MAYPDRETTVVTSSGGGAGWFVAVLLLLAILVGAFFLFGGDFFAGEREVNVDIDAPAVTAPAVPEAAPAAD